MATVPVRQKSVTSVIEPPSGLAGLDPRDLWAHRDLLGFLIRRSLKIRFAQTRAGSLWLVLQPLLYLAVYTFAFSRTGRIQGLPYPLFALSGLTPWLFVSRALGTGAMSVVTNSMIVKRVPSPRMLFPIASLCASAIDFGVTLALYFVFSGLYGVAPRWEWIGVIPFGLLAFALTFGLTLILAAYQVRYRDVATLLPLIIQLWFFVSPIAYQLPKLGAKSRVIEFINPLTGILGGFRWALTGAALDLTEVGVSLLSSVVLVAIGLVVFGRLQHNMADDL